MLLAMGFDGDVGEMIYEGKYFSLRLCFEIKNGNVIDVVRLNFYSF